MEDVTITKLGVRNSKRPRSPRLGLDGIQQFTMHVTVKLNQISRMPNRINQILLELTPMVSYDVHSAITLDFRNLECCKLNRPKAN